MRSQYVGPWRGGMRALERNMLVYRALQMMLVIFYAQQLTDEVIGSVQATNRWLDVGPLAKGAFHKTLKGAPKIAFRALVDAGVLTAGEAAEMRKLVDFRNRVAHELHSLVADLSEETIAREHIEFSRGYVPYDYAAVDRLRHFDKLLRERLHKRQFTTVFSFTPMVFRSAERAFLSELKRLRKRIERLRANRIEELAALNSELSLEGSGLTDEHHPRGPLAHYDNARLTARGVEIVYRLFDLGKSITAVAYLSGLSIRAARKRRTMWAACGGRSRPAVDLDALPERAFYRRWDDD